MPNTFKNYLIKNANTTTQTVFTAGAGVQATVIGLTLANMTNAPVSANVFLTSSGVDYYVVYQATVPVGGSLVPIGGDQKVVLEAADILKVSATANCDVICSVLEIS
jgi:phosphoribosylcarboxyaminoimidazole (NCAIR) mutase